MKQIFRTLVALPPVAILSTCSRWVVLEIQPRDADPEAISIPASLAFPLTTLSKEQEKWLGLLESGRL